MNKEPKIIRVLPSEHFPHSPIHPLHIYTTLQSNLLTTLFENNESDIFPK